jgi:hypothetical protein
MAASWYKGSRQDHGQIKVALAGLKIDFRKRDAFGIAVELFDLVLLGHARVRA